MFYVIELCLLCCSCYSEADFLRIPELAINPLAPRIINLFCNESVTKFVLSLVSPIIVVKLYAIREGGTLAVR